MSMSEAKKRFLAKKKNRITDLQRVLTLPRRDPAPVDLTPELKQPQGTWSLNKPQNDLLNQAVVAGGAIGAIGVGGGKTLAALLLPDLMEAERPLLLIPAPMRNQLRALRKEYAKQFKIDRSPRVMSYHELSHLEYGELDPLSKYKPDLIIADECHKLANKDAARTRRFIRYFQNNPDTRFVGLTGTLFSKSINDAAHLIELALRDKSPIPLTWAERQSWALCIDAPNGRLRPGPQDWAKVRPLVESFTPGDLNAYDHGTYKQRRKIARAAFFKRFSTAAGVVHTVESSCNAPIYMELLHDLHIPANLLDALRTTNQTWTLPGGEEIDDPMALARHLRQLAMGFYYRWVWPNNEPDLEWLEYRAEYRKQVRLWCNRSKPGQDSPRLVQAALDAGDIRYKPLQAAAADWSTVKHRPKPPTEAVWLSNYLIEDIKARVKGPAIIWYSHKAVADALEAAGVEVLRPGDSPEHIDTARTVALSIASHGTGKNLQKWHRNYILCPPSSGRTWEQLLGRTHRQGQESDEVWVHCYQHTEDLADALDAARVQSHFQAGASGQKQKLNSFVNFL